MMDSALVGRKTHRPQFLEEHSINRPLPLGFEPQTQFKGFTFLQEFFFMGIAYRISLGKSKLFLFILIHFLSHILRRIQLKLHV